MSALTAHSIATHAAGKTAATGDAAPKAMSGMDAIFAALLAEQGGDSGPAADASAQVAAPDASAAAQPDIAKLTAQLLNASAPAAIAQAAKTKQAHAVQPDNAAASTGGHDGRASNADAPIANAQAATDAASSKTTNKPRHKPADAHKGGKDRTAQPADAAATGPTSAAIAAAPAQPDAADHKPVAIKTADATAAVSPDAGHAKHGTPAAHPSQTAAGAPHQSGPTPAPETRSADAAPHPGVPGAIKPGQPHTPVEGLHPPRDQDNHDHAAAKLAAKAGVKTDTKAEVLTQALGADKTPKPDSTDASNLLAQARKAAMHKGGGAAPDSGAKPAADPRAATAQRHAAALAADLAKASRHAAPAPKTAAPQLAANAPVAKAPDNNAGTAGGHPHDKGDGPASHGETPTAKPAAPAPAAAQAQFQLPHNGQSANADPSGGQPAAMAAQAPAGAPAHVAANLHVAPQSAQRRQQSAAVPLSDLGALALNIAAHSKDGTSHFDIALHPADLGSIHVHLSVDHAGAAQAHVHADNQQTLQLLQRDAHHLERALKDAGLNLTGGGLNFSLKGQQHRTAAAKARAVRRAACPSPPSPRPARPRDRSAPSYSLAPDSVRLDIRV